MYTQTQAITTMKAIPGITANGIEFFEKEGEIKMIHQGEVKDFLEIPHLVLGILKSEINKNAPVKQALEETHPDSEIRQIKQFIECRFGGLDSVPDILDNELQPAEYRNCPVRKACTLKGTLCSKFQYNGHILEWEEIELVQLLSTNMKNEVIAQELNIPLGTFHAMKKRLYEVFQVSTKQEITQISMLLNLI